MKKKYPRWTVTLHKSVANVCAMTEEQAISRGLGLICDPKSKNKVLVEYFAYEEKKGA